MQVKDDSLSSVANLREPQPISLSLPTPLSPRVTGSSSVSREELYT